MFLFGFLISQTFYCIELSPKHFIFLNRNPKPFKNTKISPYSLNNMEISPKYFTFA